MRAAVQRKLGGLAVSCTALVLCCSLTDVFVSVFNDSRHLRCYGVVCMFTQQMYVLAPVSITLPSCRVAVPS